MQGTEQDQAYQGSLTSLMQQTGLGNAARTSSSHQGLPGSRQTPSHPVSGRDGQWRSRHVPRMTMEEQTCPQDGQGVGRSRLGWCLLLQLYFKNKQKLL